MSSNQVQFEMRPEDVGRAVRIAAIGLAVFAVILIAYRSMYQVQANERAVVLRFGRYIETADPGLHFCIPFVDEVMPADMQEHSLRLPFGETFQPAGRADEDDVLMLTGDLNAAAVE